MPIEMTPEEFFKRKVRLDYDAEIDTWATKLEETMDIDDAHDRAFIIAQLKRALERCKIYRKGRDIEEVFKMSRQGSQSPIVDKRFGVIFMVRSGYHEEFMTSLWEYFSPEDNGNTDPGQAYITKGLGYYMSSLDLVIIIDSVQLRPDRFDDLVLNTYPVDDTSNVYT